MKRFALETFVVRIYRRDPDDPGRLSGTVENAERGVKVPFEGADALLATLSGKVVRAGSRHRPPGRTPPLAVG
jgi:hypothetical protein